MYSMYSSRLRYFSQSTREKAKREIFGLWCVEKHVRIGEVGVAYLL